MFRLIHSPLLLFLLCCSAFPGAMVRARAGEPPLTSLQEAKSLTPAAAEESKRPVHVRGFLTATSRYRATGFIQQGEVSLRVVFPTMEAMPAPNSEVEITGVIRGNGPAREIFIESHNARTLAAGVTPRPRTVAISEVSAAENAYIWMEVEGTVNDMEKAEKDLLISLTDGRSTCIVTARDLQIPEAVKAYGNAQLRIRGLSPNASGAANHLLTYGEMNITVIQQAEGHSTPAATADPETALPPPFDGTLASAALHAFFPRNTDGLFSGTFIMTDTLGRWRILADDGTPIMAHPAAAVSAECPESLPQGTPVLLYGRAAVQGGFLTVIRASLRTNGRARPLPEAQAVTFSEADSARSAGRLITVTGRLLSLETRAETSARPPGKPALYIAAFLSDIETGNKIAVICPPDCESRLQSLLHERVLQVTGYQIPSARSGGVTPQIWPRDSTDLRDMGLTRTALHQRLWWGGAGLGLLLLAGGGLIWALREKLRRQRTEAAALNLREQAMLEHNASLEHRVADRTAELEKARADLAAALHEEREVGELKSRFVSTVSHEFRTPLGVIMSATDILSRYRDRLPVERQEEHLSEIREATRHMSGMMEDILLLGRAESGRITSSPRTSDLVELLHRLADETRSAARQTGQTRITAGSLPGPARVDETLLRHMFTNLLSNAVKYSPEGADITVSVRAEGSDAVISITDTGIGIPAEDARKLFQPFARAANVGERPGSGLGLVIVKRCAELHGGTVSFTSIPGAGTTFVLTLPAWPA